MPIDGGMRDRLEPGTVLTGRYKGSEHRAEEIRDDAGTTRYRLEDGREFRSPSAAASAVMDGKAANGWRFWSLQGDTPATDARATPTKARKARRPQAAGPVAAEAEPTDKDTPDD